MDPPRTRTRKKTLLPTYEYEPEENTYEYEPEEKVKKKIFKCKICKRCVCDAGALRDHMKCHSNKLAYACQLCPHRTNTKKYLTRHMRNVHSDGNKTNCEICNQVLAKKSVQAHMRTHTGEKPYDCEVCGKKFASTYSLSTHKLIHTDEKPYGCSFCEYACRDASTLRKHQARHLGIERMYQCNLCDRRVKSKIHLKMHIAEEHLQLDVRRHECTRCDKRFKEKSQLRIHVEQVHNKSTTVTCEICHVTISNKYNLPAHMLKHISIRPYKCTFENCCKSYKDMHTLKRHQLIHYPERQLRCDLCGRLFTRRARLVTHLKHHTKKRKCVTCEQCGYSFYNKASLEVHVNRKHGNKRQKVSCDSCGFTTYNKSLLIIHVTEHNTDVQKTYECKLCQKKFKQEISLILHCTKYHKEKNTQKLPENPRVSVKIEPDSEDDDILLSDLIHRDCESHFDFLYSTKMEIQSPKLEPEYRSSPELDNIQPSNTLTAPIEMQEPNHILTVNSTVDLDTTIESVNKEFICKEIVNSIKTADSLDNTDKMTTLQSIEDSPIKVTKVDIKGNATEKNVEIDDLVDSVEQSNTNVLNSTLQLIDCETVLDNTKKKSEISKQLDIVESQIVLDKGVFDTPLETQKDDGKLVSKVSNSELEIKSSEMCDETSTMNTPEIEINKPGMNISNVTIISPATLEMLSMNLKGLSQTQELRTVLNNNYAGSTSTSNEINVDPVTLTASSSDKTTSELQIPESRNPESQGFTLPNPQTITRYAVKKSEVANSELPSSNVLIRFKVSNSETSSSEVLTSFAVTNSKATSPLTGFKETNSEILNSKLLTIVEGNFEGSSSKLLSLESANSEVSSSQELDSEAIISGTIASKEPDHGMPNPEYEVETMQITPDGYEIQNEFEGSSSKVSSLEAANSEVTCSQELDSEAIISETITSKEPDHGMPNPESEVETMQITPDGYEIQNILNDEQQAALDVIKNNQRELKNVPEEMFDDVFLTHCLKEYEENDVIPRKRLKYLYLDKRKKENQRKRVKQLIKKISKGQTKAEQRKSRNDLIEELIREIRADTVSDHKANVNEETNVSEINENNLPSPKISIKITKENKDTRNMTNIEVTNNTSDQSKTSQEETAILDECKIQNDKQITNIEKSKTTEAITIKLNADIPKILVNKSRNSKKSGKTPKQSKHKSPANKAIQKTKPKTRKDSKSSNGKETALKNTIDTENNESLNTDEQISLNNKINKRKKKDKCMEQDLDETEKSEKDDDSDYHMSEDDSRTPKVTFNMHQCYVCFKLFLTKELLLNHCKDHFDICNKKLLKKCPLCDYVSHSNLTRHVYLIHGIKINLFGATMKEKKQRNTSGYFLELRNKKIPDIEVIPSVKNLNKIAYMNIDEKNRKEKDKTVAKSKLVRKGKEWVVVQEKINLESDDLVIPKIDDVDGTDYAEKMKSLSVAAKKEGKKILFPCNGCDKICRSMAALKLHLRRHNPNAKPFKKKVWKHKQHILGTSGQRIPENEPENKTVNTDNRNAKPKPVRNNHKCDRKLIEFYHNNIKGKDIEFWQFLKIYNKMSRENIKDFKDLLESPNYGIHTHEDIPISEDMRINKTNILKNNQVNNDTKILGTQKRNVGKRNKIIEKIVKNCGNRSYMTEKIKKKTEKDCLKVSKAKLSKSEMLRRNAIKQRLREKIAKSKELL